MTQVVPLPEPEDVPFNEPVTVTLAGGEEATITFTPQQRGETMVLPVLAVSKHPNSTYRVRIDGTTVFGPAKVPPTDVDDLGVTFLPAREFAEALTVRVTNLGTSPRVYTVQPVGYERPQGGDA